jgi:hypothetical protein
MSEILVLIPMWIQALQFKLSACLRQLQKSQPPMRARAVRSNMESTQPPYMGVIVQKLYQEAQLSRMRALKLVVKLDGQAFSFSVENKLYSSFTAVSYGVHAS